MKTSKTKKLAIGLAMLCAVTSFGSLSNAGWDSPREENRAALAALKPGETRVGVCRCSPGFKCRCRDGFLDRERQDLWPILLPADGSSFQVPSGAQPQAFLVCAVTRDTKTGGVDVDYDVEIQNMAGDSWHEMYVPGDATETQGDCVSWLLPCFKTPCGGAMIESCRQQSAVRPLPDLRGDVRPQRCDAHNKLVFRSEGLGFEHYTFRGTITKGGRRVGDLHLELRQMDWKAAEKQKPQQFQADDHPIGRLLQDCEDALCSHRTQRDEQKAVIEQLYATVWSDKDTTARRVPLHMRREWETRNTPERCKLTLESRGETFQIMLGTETRTSRTDWKFRGFAKTSTMKAEPAALQANGVTAVENANRLGNCRCQIVDNYFFNALPGFPGGCGQLIQVWGGRPATPGAVADGRFWFTCRGVENPDEIYILEIEA